jgi:hypothetical protein
MECPIYTAQRIASGWLFKQVAGQVFTFRGDGSLTLREALRIIARLNARHALN